MAADDKPGGFWSSLPGILTASAGVITAVAGLMVSMRPSAVSSPSGPTSPESTARAASAVPAAALPATARTQAAPTLPQPERQGAASADSVEILSVTPSPSHPLVVGQDTTFTIRARYRLETRKDAVLAIFLEEFPETDQGCTGPLHQTSGGKLVSIAQGTSEIQVSVKWQRTVSPTDKDRLPGGRGHLSVGSNLWASNERRPGSLVSQFGTFPKFCLPYRVNQPTTKS